MDGSVMRAIARTGFIICILATTGRSATATAEEQRAPDRMPDFSGTWTRDVKRSEKPFTGPSTIVIEQTGSELTTRSTKDQARVERYRLDASESVNEERDGTKSKSTARWDGETLVVTSAVTPQAVNPYTRTTTYTLASGGKELIINTDTVSAAAKPLRFKQVWVRQKRGSSGRTHAPGRDGAHGRRSGAGSAWSERRSRRCDRRDCRHGNIAEGH
jgi:hypothetical protein